MGADLILLLFSLLILMSFYFWLTYASAESLALRDEENRRNQERAFLTCDGGQCPTDQVTGEKICPPPGQNYQFVPTTQVCSAATSCTSTTLPFAVNSDSSTTASGLCPINPVTGTRSECRCSRNFTCAEYIVAAFTNISGNPYVAFNSTRTAFSQIFSSAYGGTRATKTSESGTIVVDPTNAVYVSNPNTTFCQVPVSWLYRSSPGCSSVSPYVNARTQALDCVRSDPCGQGTLAFITNDSTAFNTRSMNTVPVACVAAARIDGSPFTSCTDINNTVPVYDTSYGGINCVVV